ncbi:Endo-alpha-N-acetylgalactosaminidase precursor [Clostridiales bacterium CHKCI001]|nr:Endo-alpha-N-acetylgalactosaminidase precursor [Clostridiales bacterium CHKCI001]
MEKRKKRVLSWLLVAVMVISQLIPSNAIHALAQEETSVWRTFAAGSSTNDSAKRAYLTLQNPEAKGLEAGRIQMTFRSNVESLNKTYIGIKSSSNQDFIGIATDTTNKWFIQNKSQDGTKNGWIGLENVTAPKKEEEVKLDIKFDTNEENPTLEVSINGETKTISQTANGGNNKTLELLSTLKESGIALILGIPSANISFKDFTVSKIENGEETVVVANGADEWALSTDENGETYDDGTSTEEPGKQPGEEVPEIWRKFSAANGSGDQNQSFLKLTNPEAQGIDKGRIRMVVKRSGKNYFAIHAKGVNQFIGVGVENDWFWQARGTENGKTYNGYTSTGVAASGEETILEMKFEGTKLWITINGTPCNNGNPYEPTSSKPGLGLLDVYKEFPIGIQLASGTVKFKDVEVFKTNDDGTETCVVGKTEDTWEVVNAGEYDQGKPTVYVNVTGKIVDESQKPIADAKVRMGSYTEMTGEDGTYAFSNIPADEYTLVISKTGYQTASIQIQLPENDFTVDDIVLKESEPVDYTAPDTIASEEMEVGIDNTFPRVIGYTMKTESLNGKKMLGETETNNTIVLNKTSFSNPGVVVTPKVTYTKTADNQATYVMEVKDDANSIDATITSTLTVEGNTLTYKITNIENHKPVSVKTIQIPALNLLSVRSTQSAASFSGANMSTSVIESGDTHFEVDGTQEESVAGYMYAFVSADGLSAGLWSNSEATVTRDWQRVVSTVSNADGYQDVSLASNYWIYQKGEEYRAENTEEELPCTKIAITGDENEDGMVDWQDGAIAYRSIMNNPYGWEDVKDMVSMRISMNMASQAQNPFLLTLDNVKKVYLHTDGLGQMVLLKGYASEGHDAGHPDYADIGERMGGAEDMKTLLDKGAEYGAKFGIHVNASEMYPEAEAFDEELIGQNSSHPDEYSYQWNWGDSGYGINADFDLRSGRRAERWNKLREALGGDENKLNFIYIDVWGNGASGDNTTWPSRQLAKEVTNCGWRVANEWGYANEYDSTFQHWATDLSYGTQTSNGINSAITRFIRNHQKDSWVADNPKYGGAAVNPLLGGYDMSDFEGWRGRNDYDDYIYNIFDDDIASKFVQHYLVMKWVEGETVELAGSEWTPEMEVTLQDEARENTLVITRQSNDPDKAGYQLRTMMFNGKKIMDGETYLIPWFWDQNGDDLAEEDYKLYHWNQKGGTTTWEVPEGWSGTVKLYRLTELGKTDEVDVPIVDGTITLTAEAGTPYVVHKGTSANPEIQWSENAHIVDTGFNSGTLDHWTIKGEGASIVKNATANPMLRLNNTEGVVSLTQTLTDLTPGQKYAAYVGVDNTADAKAYIEVNASGETISNYTEKSIAQNYSKAYAHNRNCSTTIEDPSRPSYFQNMYVFFTAPEDGSDVTLTLKRDAGEGAAYFDDIRIVENESNLWVDETTYVQGFENVAQGLYPFVLGGAEGVVDNRPHLSKLHTPYTQAGWNGKLVNDVIDGEWSVKIHGKNVIQRNNVVYQTIPQNFRFEPGVSYTVSFQYESGSNGTFAAVTGDDTTILTNVPLEKTNGTANTYTFNITGSKSGQSWIGIYSTNQPAESDPSFTEKLGANLADAKNQAVGYTDFILDNLTITSRKANVSELQQLVEESEELVKDNYSEVTWNTFNEALVKAKEVLADTSVDQDTVDKAREELQTAKDQLEVIASIVTGTVTDKDGNKLSGITVTAKANEIEITAKTDTNGIYVLNGLTFGEWTITAESDRYDAVEEVITTSKDETKLTKDFVLEQVNVTIIGQVTQVGRPVEGATVSVTVNDKATTAVTNANGTYELKEIPAGTYVVKAEKEGFDPASITAKITKDGTANVDLMLAPISAQQAYANVDNQGNSTWEYLATNPNSISIQVVNGKTEMSFQDGTNDATNFVRSTVIPGFENGSVEMDLVARSTASNVGFVLRMLDSSNYISVGTKDKNNEWCIKVVKDGVVSEKDFTAPEWKTGEILHVKSEIVGNTIKLWLNNELVLDTAMNAISTGKGYIALGTSKANTLVVDNMKATIYDTAGTDIQTIAGYVSKDGNPVKDADVALYNSANTEEAIATVKTDANGNYKFPNIAYGDYIVKVTRGEDQAEVTVKSEKADFYCVAPAIDLKEEPDIPTVDKTILQAVADIYDTYEETEYTAESWAPFAQALKDAKDILAKEDATQEEVDTAIEVLRNAAKGLTKAEIPVPVDKNAIKVVTGIYKTYEETGYTAESWAVFAEALKAADQVIADEAATQEQVDVALEALIDAGERLQKAEKPVEINKVGLEVAVTIYGSYEESEYTQESWAVFAQVLKDAQTVLADETATQEQVDAALEAVMSAAAGLEKIEAPVETPLKVSYRTHVQNEGWQDFVSDGAMSGTKGKGLRLEGIEIRLDYNTLGGGIEYRTHVQNEGWQDYVADGAMSGTKGKSLRLEAIQIRLTGGVAEKYDVYYRTHIQDKGWLGWAVNDGKSGSAGLSKRLEGIEIRLVQKGGAAPGSTENAYLTNQKEAKPSVIYTTHVQNIGWQEEVHDGAMAGTKGKGLRLEGIKIRVNGDGIQGGIEYSTHVQNLGWQPYVSNGEVAGTKGKSLRLEGIKIRLTGELAEKYSVEYRTHVQNEGWQNWVRDDEMSGTKGKGLRLEGIEIRLVKK